MPDESSGAGVRAFAARLNDAVVTGGESVSGMAIDDAELPARDRSLARAMLMESLRWHHRYEWQISRLLDRPLKRRDHQLASLLRIGLTQLDALRIPDHAAVAATVAAAARLGFGHARGLVNAVLRRHLREREALCEAMHKEEVPCYSHPQWLIMALKQDWPDDWRDILTANNAPPPMWLRVNRQRSARQAYIAELAAAGFEGSPSPTAADAVLLDAPCAVAELPGFDAGRVSVQDAGAQFAANLLEPEAGMRVLDACAAPGGKTGHILEICPDLAELVAIDNDRDRLDRVASNLERLGFSATLICADAGDTGSWFDGARFERILLDVPCSASGVIRRHPDIKLLRREGDIKCLAARQRGLVKALWPLLAPGGRLVYVSCSVLAAENGGVMADVVEAEGDASLAPFGSARHFQLLPGEANMDGFYYACLTKAASG